MRLENKIALITGGSAGIGEATAQLFAEQGAHVAIADLDEANGKTVVDGIINQGGQALFNQVDVSNEQQVKNWIDTVVNYWGSIDILVNNAADGIRVNCVCPGTIETQATLSHAQSVGLSKQALVEEIKNQHLIKRLGQPREVAQAVLFLASDEASFITGTHLIVDGGHTTH